jgi:hypothetical protein
MQVANDTDLNKELQAAYRTLNEIVVNAINPDIIIGYLFAAKVLSTADSVDLLNITPEASKSRKILMLLHSRGHPEAFVKLHEAIKEESTCDWLVKQVEDLRTSSKGNVSDAFKHVVEGTAYYHSL